MNKLLIAIAAIGLSVSTAAIAQDNSAGAATTPDFTTTDADANGSVSLSEAQAVWPDLTEDQFNTADANADGALDETEFTALAGTMSAGAAAAPAQ